MLTRTQTDDYHRDGFLVIEHFKSPEDVAALRKRATEIVDAFDPGERSSVFTTKDQARTSDAAFLASAEGIHCFLEEEALDAQGRLTRPKSRAVNKIGHALHDLDPAFDRFSRDPRLAAVAADLGIAQPLLWQSMVIFKQPGIGGEVRWHQDATFFDTDPITVIGFWFALEDADRSNGCLWAEPDGHRGPLRERFVRDGDAVRVEPVDPTPWPDIGRAVPLEVAAGTLVCLHGLLPHYSAPNRSSVSRQAYSLHVTDAGSVYSPRNWLRRGPALPVRGFERI